MGIIATDEPGDAGMEGVQEQFRDHTPTLLAALKAIVDFCDDPHGSEKPESLAMGLSRLLPAARAALGDTRHAD